MKGLVIEAFSPGHSEQAVDLWERCGLERPGNDSRAMIEEKLRFQPDLFLAATMDGRLVATVMAGYEGRRGWINLLAVEPDFRRQGIARAMMDEAEARLRALGCPKINLQVRESNSEAIGFYERIGYSTDHVRSFGKRLEH